MWIIQFRKIIPIFNTHQDTPTIGQIHDESGSNSKNKYQNSSNISVPAEIQSKSVQVIVENDAPVVNPK